MRRRLAALAALTPMVWWITGDKTGPAALAMSGGLLCIAVALWIVQPTERKIV